MFQRDASMGPSQQNVGMTLEDDVESMLSEQFNTSNDSTMFKVRGVTAHLGQDRAFAIGHAGDSTYRCNDSAQDDERYAEERGLISESEDGWYPDKERKADFKEDERDNEFDDISEHSSDEITDSEPENADNPGEEKVKKVKKKGDKKKKKKKKIE